MASDDNNNWQGAFFLLLIIVIIIVIILVVLFVRREGTEGSRCSSDRDCQNGFFCSSDGICLSGSGGTGGTVCVTDNDCQIGLVCVNGICGVIGIPPVTPPVTTTTVVIPDTSPTTPFSSFVNKTISYQASVGNLFLTVLKKQVSVWSQNRMQTFSYSSSRNEMSLFTRCDCGYSCDHGKKNVKLTIGLDGAIHIGPASNFFIVTNSTNQIVILDQYNNQLGVGTDNFAGLAVFNDRTHYPNLPTGLTWQAVTVDINDAEIMS